MKCSKCGGELRFITVEEGFYSYKIQEDSEIDYTDEQFHGDKSDHIECMNCGYLPDWDWGEEFGIVLAEDKEGN